MKSQLLDLNFHIRHKNKQIQEITNQTRKEVRNECNPSKSHKAHLKMLMSVINTLPEEQRADFSGIKSMISSDSPKPKENYPTASSLFNTRSAFKIYEPCISEIPYKSHVESEDFLYKLFISDVKTANDLAELQKRHIYALLTFGEDNNPSKYTFLKGGYLCLPLEDTSGNLKEMMDKVVKFFDRHLIKGNILVHCSTGNSRSCAAVIGYFIKKYRMTYEKAYSIVKEGRPSLKLAYALERQLRRIERAELYN